MLNWQKYKKSWNAKFKKLKGSPHAIALGIACGIAISFTPFVGAHLMLAVIVAWLLRGNIMAAMLGTAAGNPWTFPFIWFSVWYTGNKILRNEYENNVDIDFAKMFAKTIKALIKCDFDLFFSDVWPILWPMMIGCIPFCFVVGIASYYIILAMLKR